MIRRLCSNTHTDHMSFEKWAKMCREATHKKHELITSNNPCPNRLTSCDIFLTTVFEDCVGILYVTVLTQCNKLCHQKRPCLHNGGVQLYSIGNINYAVGFETKFQLR